MTNATLTVAITGVTENDITHNLTGTYTAAAGTPTGSNTAPTVDVGGNISIYEATDITFNLTGSNCTFFTSGNLVKIDTTQFGTENPGNGCWSVGTPTPPPNPLTLVLTDDNNDESTPPPNGVTHTYSLTVRYKGQARVIDPNLYNKN